MGSEAEEEEEKGASQKMKDKCRGIVIKPLLMFEPLDIIAYMNNKPFEIIM